jgi:hypothetical protein
MPQASELVPIPLVQWETVVSANDPTAVPTRARYRTIRDHGYATDGLRVQRRSERYAAGTSTVHSVLSVLAAHARRANDAELAYELLVEGAAIEREYARALKPEGRTRELNPLDESRAKFEHLQSATRDALGRVAGWSSAIFAEAFVDRMEGPTAHLSGVTPAGTETVIDMPRALIESWDLEVGDPLFVFQAVLGASVVVEVLPAIGDRDAEREHEAFLRALNPDRPPQEGDRLRSLVASGAVGRRSLKRVG